MINEIQNGYIIPDEILDKKLKDIFNEVLDIVNNSKLEIGLTHFLDIQIDNMICLELSKVFPGNHVTTFIGEENDGSKRYSVVKLNQHEMIQEINFIYTISYNKVKNKKSTFYVFEKVSGYKCNEESIREYCDTHKGLLKRRLSETENLSNEILTHMKNSEDITELKEKLNIQFYHYEKMLNKINIFA